MTQDTSATTPTPENPTPENSAPETAGTEKTGLPAAWPWIERLLRIPTVSYESDEALLELIRAEAERLGLTAHLTWADEHNRANLLITVSAADGATSGGVLLSGHTDVVPVQGQPWDTDPFEPVIRDGRVYARGAADMKSYVGAMLWLLGRAAEAELAEPLHFAFTYDEEPGCLGAPRLIADLAERGIRPDFALVGEPTLMNIVVAHKAPFRGKVTFHGVPKHSSLAPYGINAVSAAARFIAFFDDLVERERTDGPQAEGFNIPWTTGGVNVIRGGAAHNIVAEEVVLEYDLRIVPATDPEELRARIQTFLDEEIEPALAEEVRRVRELGGADEQALARVGTEHEVLASVPALSESPEAPVVRLAQELGAVLDGGGEVPYVSYGTEAGQYYEAGIPAIVCGPGSIAQAHTANEWVALEQIEACQRYLLAVLERARG
ncbi:M20/M25/M40 family metallo-hydrolase [Rothia kristinae]|uniref:M20/M25/M40 family metallo-hydrolase n=1 Tax=Rothia kristinae TaxID=37923 RepID=UPI0009BF244F|nr:M20/M25/M40 family metallo-hydrolase [Rothia kristinae]MBG7587811.1 M20/M25/M40 family metallo-hydrolase [Rothia kristinae]WGH09490.1 M20/M25/M40 family metallo-hydrolase [Rothia kristinae]